jgi:hypothetical protein
MHDCTPALHARAAAMNEDIGKPKGFAGERENKRFNMFSIFDVRS